MQIVRDWLIEGFLSDINLSCWLNYQIETDKIPDKSGIYIGKASFIDDGLVEVPYGITLDFEGTKEPRLFSYEMMGGTFLGRFQLTKYFPSLPTDSVSASRSPGLEQLAREFTALTLDLQNKKANFEDLSRYWGKQNPLNFQERKVVAR